MTFAIATTDNNLLEGTRTVQVQAFASGYIGSVDTVELREDGVLGVTAATDGFASDTNLDGTFDAVNTTTTGPRTSISTSANFEDRALFEIPLSNLGASGILEAASLTVQVYRTPVGSCRRGHCRDLRVYRGRRPDHR